MDTLTADPTFEYALGHSTEEQQRLDRQGVFLRPASERWLRDAGISSGMRVLDVGCGSGDVTRLAADLVGPNGFVLGVDRSPEAVETVRRSAAARGLSQISAEVGDIADLKLNAQFDAVIGRLVLMYQDDPAEVVTRLATLVRPGGIVAFSDYYFLPATSFPARTLLPRIYDWTIETLRRASPNADLGVRLHQVYQDAGLPVPQMRAEILTGVAGDPVFTAVLVDVTRTLLPVAVRLGVTTAEQVQIETLQERLVQEGRELNSLDFGPVFVTAFAKLPG